MTKSQNIPAPLPLFDDLKHFFNFKPNISALYSADYQQARSFLKSYDGSVGTFNSYRREIEKLLQWSWYINNKTLLELRRADIEEFIRFIQDPPQAWIGIKKSTRFISTNQQRTPNPEWRPFVSTLSKGSHRNGEQVTTLGFSLSSGSVKESFAILSSFFNYLLQEEYLHMNPVALIRQKNKFIRRTQGNTQIRRLSELQWQYIIQTATELANNSPAKHERSLFILSALYSMYLRISELAASPRWLPNMNNFHRDHDQNWWFSTLGKGNKQREIAVSDAMLAALKRWRKFLGLTTLPSPADNSPLLPKIKGKGPITSTTYLRELVQECFDQSMQQLQKDGFIEEAESLIEATVHWLRHTGISDDIKHRPREHVRDDAGHSSSATTDKYIDIELRARHQSAKHKQIIDHD